MKKLEYHPAANIFPMMSKEEAAGLLKDIEEKGQCYAIELYEGKILDGRNRYEACLKLEIECETVDVTDDIDDPADHVRSVNLHRRHLSASQRAMVASRTQEYYAERAKERQQEAGKKHGRGHRKLEDHGPQAIRAPQSRDEIGKAYDVSGRSVDRATSVIEHGAPELIDAVDSGELTVRMAQKVIDLSVKEQRQIAKAEEPAKEAKRILREKKEAELKAQEGGIRGGGVFRGNDAVDCLRRIPPDDALRRDGYQIVEDFVKMHKNKKPKDYR